jgi:hypothetical protein
VTNLEELQRALAQALVATEQRPSTGPIALTDNQALNDPALAGISRVELQRAGQTLIRKRLSHVRSQLPRTTAALGRRLSAFFRTFASQHHFSGYRAPLRDSIGFSQFIAVQHELPPWVHELARWEAMFCRWTLSQHLFWVVRLRYRIFDPAGRFSYEEEPHKRRTIWLAYRLGGRGRILRVI